MNFRGSCRLPESMLKRAAWTGRQRTVSRRCVVLLLENDEQTREAPRRELARSFEVIACVDERSARATLQGEPLDTLVVRRQQRWEMRVGILCRWRQCSNLAPQTFSRRLQLLLDDRRRGLESGVDVYLDQTGDASDPGGCLGQCPAPANWRRNC